MAAKATDKFGGLDVFYPIVPDLAWLERLVPLGVKTVQLRLKDAPPEQDPPRDRPTASRSARRHGCQLIVNDYWREALSLGADYIHLGQEDLADADVAAIQAKGIRLGISTHSEEELAIALAAAPRLRRARAHLRDPPESDEVGAAGARRASADWKKRIGPLPLVAIGGITPARADGVLAAGADSLAVITDFLHPSRSGGPRASVAGLGGGLPGLIAGPAATVSRRRAVLAVDCDSGKCLIGPGAAIPKLPQDEPACPAAFRLKHDL